MRYLRITLMGLLAAVLLVSSVWGQKKSFTATIDTDGVQRVDVLAGSYFYSPDHIIVKVNVPVEMKIKRESGVTPHNIILKAPDAGMDFVEDLADSPKTIRFTPTKTGKYPFYCDKKFLFFKSHKEQGMEGIVEVVP